MSHWRAWQRRCYLTRCCKARAVVFPGDVCIHVHCRYGDIPAGFAVDAEQESQGCITVDINTLGVPRNAGTFALKVRGDSMTGAHIIAGDFVVLEVCEPQPKDIVAALIDGETTLKRYIVRNGLAYLKADNL